MSENIVGRRATVTDLGYKPEAHLFNGHTGTIVGEGFFYYTMLLDEPVNGFGVPENPLFVLRSEFTPED